LLSDRIKLLFAERGVPQPPEELIDDIEAAVVGELRLTDTVEGTNYTTRVVTRISLEPPPLTDAERRFFEGCMKPDLR
jgi:hypothetical protein